MKAQSIENFAKSPKHLEMSICTLHECSCVANFLCARLIKLIVLMKWNFFKARAILKNLFLSTVDCLLHKKPLKWHLMVKVKTLCCKNIYILNYHAWSISAIAVFSACLLVIVDIFARDSPISLYLSLSLFHSLLQHIPECIFDYKIMGPKNIYIYIC